MPDRKPCKSVELHLSDLQECNTPYRFTAEAEFILAESKKLDLTGAWRRRKQARWLSAGICDILRCKAWQAGLVLWATPPLPSGRLGGVANSGEEGTLSAEALPVAGQLPPEAPGVCVYRSSVGLRVFPCQGSVGSAAEPEGIPQCSCQRILGYRPRSFQKSSTSKTAS